MTVPQKILDYLRPDGKTQVTVEYDENDRPKRIDTIVISSQHSPDVSQEELRKGIIENVIKPIIPENFIDENTIDVYIGYLRQKISEFSKDEYIKTVRGAGYMMG